MIDDPWYGLANRIRSERERLGLSTTQLAEHLDVSRTTIHNWENGKPIPIERCAALAELFGIDTEQLLALHPHSMSLTNDEDPSTSLPVARIAVVGGLAVVAVVIGAMFVTWFTAKTECFEVGAGGGSLLGPFRDAYETIGEANLGCAINEVHKWGPSDVQDFEDGALGRSSLMTRNGVDIYALTGDLWWDYVDIADGVTPDLVGIPSTPELHCGDLTVILLEGGFAGPGALVENSAGDHHVWLAGDIWKAYESAGGPLGPLGPPVGDEVTRDATGEAAEFANGTITHLYGDQVSLDPPAASTAPFSPDQCTQVR